MKEPKPHRQSLGTLLGLCALALAGAPMALLSQDPLPSGEQIRERYINALGGVQALQSPKSSHVTGTFEIPAQGITGSMEMFGAAPDKLYTRMEMPGAGLVRTGYDGEVAWTINSVMGPMLIEGPTLQQLRQQADFYSVLHLERHIDSFEPVARKEFEGKSCYEVRVTTKWGEEYLEYYEVDTGLQAGTVRTQESPMGPIEATTVVSEYGKFGAILVPTKVEQRAMGMLQVMTIVTVEYDTVADSMFAIPPEIKALVEAAQKDTSSGRP
ncbi:MAG: hypothetical protein JSW71_10140 [Gemmatimonadota bacterium]|nr:MAG: hypothetical protein JSW71_10140 [Gemmatimonadota bacterium]